MLLGSRTWACLCKSFHGALCFFFLQIWEVEDKWIRRADSPVPSCLTSLHLSLSLSALRRIVRDAVWVARSLRCDIEYTVKASRPTH